MDAIQVPTKQEAISRLKLWRKRNALGVRGAAKVIGLSPATISRIERGENISLDSYFVICSLETSQ